MEQTETEQKQIELKKELEKKKEWLDGYRYKVIEFGFYMDELEYYQERKKGLTHILTGLPGGSGTKRMDDTWIELIDEMDELAVYLKNQIKEIQKDLETIDQALKKLAEREKTILILRHVKGMNFKDIQKKMYCSERTMYNIYKDALININMPLQESSGE